MKQIKLYNMQGHSAINSIHKHLKDIEKRYKFLLNNSGNYTEEEIARDFEKQIKQALDCYSGHIGNSYYAHISY